jgi:hypothetical protein
MREGETSIPQEKQRKKGPGGDLFEEVVREREKQAGWKEVRPGVWGRRDEHPKEQQEG